MSNVETSSAHEQGMTVTSSSECLLPRKLPQGKQCALWTAVFLETERLNDKVYERQAAVFTSQQKKY